MMGLSRSKTLLLVLLALLVLPALLAACGSSGGDSTADSGSAGGSGEASAESAAPEESSNTAAPEEKASGTPIKVGAVWDYQSAQLAFSKEFRAGMLAAEGAINATGGVDGRPIELDVCDTQENPSRPPLCAQQFENDGVVGVTGASIVWGPAGMPQFAKSGIPNMTIPNDPSEWEAANSFPLLGGGVASYAAQAKFFLEKGVKKAAVLELDLPLTRDLVNAVYIKQLDAAGVSTKAIPVKLGAADLTPYVVEAQESGAEVVFCAMDNATAIRAMQAGTQIGFEPDWSLGDSMNPSEIGEAGPAAQDAYVDYALTNLAEESNEEVSAFRSAMEEYGQGEAVTNYAGYGYATLMTLRNILGKVAKEGKVTAKALFAYLEGVEGEPVVMGKELGHEFSPKQFPRILNPFYNMLKWNGTEFVTEAEGINGYE